MDDQQRFEKLFAKLYQIERALTFNSRLWDINDIAQYTKNSRTTVHTKIICQPDFPRPVNRMEGHPRWEPKKVRAYFGCSNTNQKV